MKVLLDECVNARLRHHLSTTHTVSTVPQMGWAGVKNGKLLALAAAQFDVLITLDSALPDQQNLANHNLAVIVLKAASNKIDDLLPLVPHIEQAIGVAPKGKATIVP